MTPHQFIEKEVKDYEEMMQSPSEQNAFSLFLDNFRAVLPKRLSVRKAFLFNCLLRRAVNLWGIGKLHQMDEVRKYYWQQLRNAKVKPEQREVISRALIIYDKANRDAFGLQKWIQRFQAEWGTEPTLSSYQKEMLRGISMKEAFRRADPEGKFPTAYATYLRKNNQKKFLDQKKRRMKILKKK